MNRWSQKLWEDWHLTAKRVKLQNPTLNMNDNELWTIDDAEILRGYVSASYEKYAKSTVKNIIIAGLKRNYILFNKKPLPDEMLEALKHAQIQLNFDAKGEREKSKEAALIQDVRNIIKAMPDGLVTKAEEASLYLAAVQTGGRRITMVHVILKDIVGIIPLTSKCASNGDLRITLCYRVTKGCHDQIHHVNLTGNTDTKSNGDFVYWFNIHLQKSFNLHLKEFKNWHNLHPDLDWNAQIWKGKVDTIGNMFRKRANQAGFPKNLFSFHSLRSGFLCSALLKGGLHNVDHMFVQTAAIAQWKPNGRAQYRYWQECLKACLSGTDLTDFESERPIMDPVSLTSEGFHNIPLLVPNYPLDTNFGSLYFKVQNHLEMVAKQDNNLPQQKRSLWYKAMWNLMYEWAYEEYSHETNLNVKDKKTEGRNLLVALLADNYSHQLVDDLMKSMLKYIEKDLITIKIPSPKKMPTLFDHDAEKKKLRPAPGRRMHWSNEETQLLISMVQSPGEIMSNALIASQLPRRTPEQVRLKIRSLVDSGKLEINRDKWNRSSHRFVRKSKTTTVVSENKEHETNENNTGEAIESEDEEIKSNSTNKKKRKEPPPKKSSKKEVKKHRK